MIRISTNINEKQRKYSEGMQVEVYSDEYFEWIKGIITNINHKSNSVDILLDSKQDSQNIGIVHIQSANESKQIRPRQIAHNTIMSTRKSSIFKKHEPNSRKSRLSPIISNIINYHDQSKDAKNESIQIRKSKRKSSKRSQNMDIFEQISRRRSKPLIMPTEQLVRKSKYDYEWSRSSRSSSRPQRKRWTPMEAPLSAPLRSHSTNADSMDVEKIVHWRESHPKRMSNLLSTIKFDDDEDNIDNAKKDSVYRRSSAKVDEDYDVTMADYSQRTSLSSNSTSQEPAYSGTDSGGWMKRIGMKPWIFGLIIFCLVFLLGVMGAALWVCRRENKEQIIKGGKDESTSKVTGSLLPLYDKKNKKKCEEGEDTDGKKDEKETSGSKEGDDDVLTEDDDESVHSVESQDTKKNIGAAKDKKGKKLKTVGAVRKDLDKLDDAKEKGKSTEQITKTMKVNQKKLKAEIDSKKKGEKKQSKDTEKESDIAPGIVVSTDDIRNVLDDLDDAVEKGKPISGIADTLEKDQEALHEDIEEYIKEDDKRRRAQEISFMSSSALIWNQSFSLIISMVVILITIGQLFIYILFVYSV